MKKVLLAGLVGLILAAALPASAHTGVNRRLRFFSSDTGSAHWQRHRVDSPLDANHGRIKLSQSEQTGDDYALAFANGTGVRNRRVGGIRNLSFDFRNTSYVGAGAPRISVEVDTNNDSLTDVVVYMSAFYCQEVISGDWSRSDFTGRTSLGCRIWDSVGNPYDSTGTEDAWTVFANAHTGAFVLDAYVVQDEVGSAFLDRVAFQNHMFVKPGYGPNAIVHCPTEGSC